jgi:hypothetical protein
MSIKNYRSWTVTAKRRDRNEETTFTLEGPHATADEAAAHFTARNAKLYEVVSVEPADGLPAVWPVPAPEAPVAEATHDEPTEEEADDQ